MLVHHVLFWLKNPEDSTIKNTFKQGLETLRGIESIRQVYIGTPGPPDRPVIDRSYTFSLLLVFDDMAGHDVYQGHPLHKAFLEKHREDWSKVQIYDALEA
jgi:hypothetical protein